MRKPPPIWTDWARMTLINVVMEELRRTQRATPDWKSVGKKLTKMGTNEDEEGQTSMFERIRVEACRSQLGQMVYFSKSRPKQLSAPVLTRVREFVQLRDDIVAAGRGDHRVHDSDHGHNVKSEKHGNEKELDSESESAGCGSGEVRKRPRRAPASPPPLHEEGQQGPNPRLHLGKIEQILHMLEQQEAQSRAFVNSLFRSMPKSRVVIDRLVEILTAQSMAENEDRGRHRVPPLKEMKARRSCCVSKTFDEIEKQTTRRIIRCEMVATFERFHGRLVALFRQTSCELLDMVPQFTKFLKSDSC